MADDTQLNEYLLLFRGGNPRTAHLSPAELQAYMTRWIAWVDRMHADEHWLGGRPLEPEGVIVDGDHVDHDGPFVETHEVIGGYIAIQVADLAAAIAVAKRCPIYELGGRVEVRPLVMGRVYCTDMDALDAQVRADAATVTPHPSSGG